MKLNAKKIDMCVCATIIILMVSRGIVNAAVSPDPFTPVHTKMKIHLHKVIVIADDAQTISRHDENDAKFMLTKIGSFLG